MPKKGPKKVVRKKKKLRKTPDHYDMEPLPESYFEDMPDIPETFVWMYRASDGITVRVMSADARKFLVEYGFREVSEEEEDGNE